MLGMLVAQQTDVSPLCVIAIELPFLCINSSPVLGAHLKVNSPPKLFRQQSSASFRMVAIGPQSGAFSCVIA